MAPCRSLEGIATQCSLGTLDRWEGPQQAESLAWLRPGLQLRGLSGGYSVKGTCQMRRALSVSPHRAGFPLPPGAPPKLR